MLRVPLRSHHPLSSNTVGGVPGLRHNGRVLQSYAVIRACTVSQLLGHMRRAATIQSQLGAVDSGTVHSVPECYIHC